MTKKIQTVGRLNAYYKSLIKTNVHWRNRDHDTDDYNYDYGGLEQKIKGEWNNAPNLGYMEQERGNFCCGYEELGYFAEPKTRSRVIYDECIAKQLQSAFSDTAFALYGTTTEKRFNKIVASLIRMGFGVIARGYTNPNSGNKIILLGCSK